jgi:hypothetical protein
MKITKVLWAIAEFVVEMVVSIIIVIIFAVLTNLIV